MTKSPHTGGERGIVPDWRAIGITRRLEVHDRVSGGAPVRQDMQRLRPLAGASGGYMYSAAVSAAHPPAKYTARVIPRGDGVAIPLEEARILWQR